MRLAQRAAYGAAAHSDAQVAAAAAAGEGGAAHSHMHNFNCTIHRKPIRPSQASPAAASFGSSGERLCPRNERPRSQQRGARGACCHQQRPAAADRHADAPPTLGAQVRADRPAHGRADCIGECLVAGRCAGTCARRSPRRRRQAAAAVVRRPLASVASCFAQGDFMNNCVVRTVLSAVLGSGMGVMFGVFMGTMDTVRRGRRHVVACRQQLAAAGTLVAHLRRRRVRSPMQHAAAAALHLCTPPKPSCNHRPGRGSGRRSRPPEPDATPGVPGDGQKYDGQEQVRWPGGGGRAWMVAPCQRRRHRMRQASAAQQRQADPPATHTHPGRTPRGLPPWAPCLRARSA